MSGVLGVATVSAGPRTGNQLAARPSASGLGSGSVRKPSADGSRDRCAGSIGWTGLDVITDIRFLSRDLIELVIAEKHRNGKQPMIPESNRHL
jgi:hypothetical protein